jgi:multiple sugar transport system substrate-binding protein
MNNPSSMRAAIGVGVVAALTITGVALAAVPFPTDPIQIVVSWWGGNSRNKLHNAVLDLFIKAHPNVTVDRQAADFNPYWERLAVQAAGGNAPDQMQMQSRFVAQFAAGGRTLRNLQPYVDDGTIDLKTVPAFALGAGTIGGKLVMIPSSFSFRGLMYDAEAFKAAGVEGPTLDTTWDGYADIIKKLAKAKLPDGVRPSMNECEDDSTFYAYVRGYGFQPYNEDGSDLGFSRDLAVQYFKFWHDLQEAGGVILPDVKTANNGSAAEDGVLAKRLVLMQANPANQFESLKAIIKGAAMTALPQGPKGHGDTFVVSGQSISATSDDARAAVAAHYINFFLNDPEANQVYQGDNGIPASQVGRDVIKAKGTAQVPLFEALAPSVPPFAPLPLGYAKVRDALLRNCDRVSYGQVTPEQGADQFIADARASIRK